MKISWYLDGRGLSLNLSIKGDTTPYSNFQPCIHSYIDRLIFRDLIAKTFASARVLESMRGQRDVRSRSLTAHDGHLPVSTN